MFTPKYRLTAKLLTNLNEIERFYGRLEAIKAPQNLLLNLEKTNLIQSSYASNSIEGNPLTHREVTNLILNDRVPVNRDEKEITNYFSILENLNQKVNQPIGLNTVLQIHEKLLVGVDEKIKGKIRDTQVVVGSRIEGKIIIKHNPPFYKQSLIKNSVIELINWLDNTKELSIIKAGIFHHRFVYIHPFSDGNGRVCRLLTALIFLKNHYLINKYFILDDYYDIDRLEYSDYLHHADMGDLTSWLEYFTNGIKYSLQSSLGKIETGLSKFSFEIRPTTQEEIALKIVQKYQQIKSSDLMKELKVTRQQAFNLLKALTNKGYLEKKGATKNSFYIIKSF